MRSLQGQNTVAPIHVFSLSLEGESWSSIKLRPFGTHERDLTVDFENPDTSVLVTRILEECMIEPAGQIAGTLLRNLSVGKRIECLLALAAEETRVFSFPFYCKACRQQLEIELTWDEIVAEQQKADLIDTVTVEIGGKNMQFRRPRGDDQERWTNMVVANEVDATRLMIRTLALVPGLDKDLSTGDLDVIEEALDDADPLVNFFCETRCSECSASNEFAIDLCDAALNILRRLQRRLIITVHKLASRYHWSEKEIFAVPHWRRLEYLELISTGK